MSGIKGFYFLFLSMLFFRIVDNSGAGGDIGDIGDFEIEDEDEPIQTPKEKPKEIEGIEDDEIATLKAELEETKAWREEQIQKEATTLAIDELQGKYPDFDVNKIIEYLQHVAKEEGAEKADEINNPIGWENIYLTKFRKKDEVDTLFDRGRGEAKEPFDFKKGFEKALNGDKESLAELLENSKG